MRNFLAILLLLTSVSVYSADNSAESKSIGTAEMKQNGTIVLLLRPESDDGSVGNVIFAYSPDDNDYKKILKHLGGLKPGESKLIKPWPENEKL
jgi:hypothetical protein